LPGELKTPSETHPRQILVKADKKMIAMSPDDRSVYRELQQLFNAKPDLAICIGSELLVFEAKFMMNFNLEQLKRTERIANSWIHLLFQDMGFDSQPVPSVATIGFEDPNRGYRHIYWQKLTEAALEICGENSDPSLTALENAVRYYEDGLGSKRNSKPTSRRR
jgi:hypothetical protein